MLRVSGTGTGRLVLTVGKFRNNGTNFYNFRVNRVTGGQKKQATNNIQVPQVSFKGLHSSFCVLLLTIADVLDSLNEHMISFLK
jgi:hypothetical protein